MLQIYIQRFVEFDQRLFVEPLGKPPVKDSKINATRCKRRHDFVSGLSKEGSPGMYRDQKKLQTGKEK